MSEKMQKLIEESPLIEDEKSVILSIIDSLEETQKIELTKIFSDSPWMIPYLYVNFAAKKYALTKDDKYAFRSIVDNEISLLNSLDTSD